MTVSVPVNAAFGLFITGKIYKMYGFEGKMDHLNKES